METAPAVIPTADPNARTRRLIGLTLGVGAFLAVTLIPSALHEVEGYGNRPAFMAGIGLLMAVWWFTEALPIGWTACIPLIAYPALSIYGDGVSTNVRRTFAGYLDAYIYLFLGGMVLGAAMQQWGLHRRVALHIMRAIGSDPKRLLLGVLVSTGAISLWISNTATAVMMVPIGMALVAQLELAEGGRRLGAYGASLMLAVAYGANVGGIGTKIGTPTNSLFAGFLSEKLDYDLGFLEFMAIGLPFVILFIPILWFTLWLLGRRDRMGAPQGKAVLDAALAEMGPMSGKEKLVACVFLAAALLWISGDFVRPVLTPLVTAISEGITFRSKHYEAWVAMTAAGFLLISRGITVSQLRQVPWSTLVLLGGSFALASGIEGSGLSMWLSSHVGRLAALPLWQQLLGVSLATVALSAIASNTATLNVMLNVLPPSLPVLSASTLAASCDFALPAGTPPNAIVFGSGYVRLPTMMKTGVLLDVAAALLIAVYALTWVQFLFA